jgi:hypothetical protein
MEQTLNDDLVLEDKKLEGNPSYKKLKNYNGKDLQVFMVQLAKKE